MGIRFLVPHRVASELLEHTPTYFDGEPVILVDNFLIFLSIFWWTTRYFGGELSHFAEHGLVRTTEESKISPWKSVSARNFAVSSN